MDLANKKRFFLVLLLGVVASAGVWLMRRREPSLLDHARRIPNMQALALAPDYFWLNDNELMYQKPNSEAGGSQVMRRNIETGTETVQGDLASGGLQLSPNGAWALTYTAGRGGMLFTIERADGSRKFLYRSPSKPVQPRLAWTPDDFCLVELVPSYKEKGKVKPALLRTYFLNSATAPASNTVEENATGLLLLGALPNHHVLATDTSLWFPTDTQSGNAGKAQMLDFPPERDSVAHHYTLSKPPDSLNGEAILSPQGTRIAWMFGDIHEPPGYVHLSKLYETLHIRHSRAVSFWISNPDGSDLHKVGNIPIAEAAKYTASVTFPSNLRWTNNGKNVSFLYDNSLYIVPVQ